MLKKNLEKEKSNGNHQISLKKLTLKNSTSESSDNCTCASCHCRAQGISIKFYKRASRQMSLLNLT